MPEKLTKEMVVLIWLKRGFMQLCWAFEADDRSRDHRPFHLTVAVEMFCKACILGKEGQEYEGLSFKDGKAKIDKLATHYRHNYEKMINKIMEIPGANNTFKCLTKIYYSENELPGGKPRRIGGNRLLSVASGGVLDPPRKIKGNDFLDHLKDVYIESKYPTPKSVATQPSFVVSKNKESDSINSSDKGSKNTYMDPMMSDYLDEFCIELCQEILLVIKNSLKITVSKDDICQDIHEENFDERFINKFFAPLQ